jgi:hypothetical protein
VEVALQPIDGNLELLTRMRRSSHRRWAGFRVKGGILGEHLPQAAIELLAVACGLRVYRD